MTSAATRSVGGVAETTSASSTAASTSSTTSTSSSTSEEENRKLNFDLEILCWRVSRFVENLNAQLHFDWMVLGHAESVSIRRKGVETFIDEEEEEEAVATVDEASARTEKERAGYNIDDKEDIPLQLHCVDETASEIPTKKLKSSPMYRGSEERSSRSNAGDAGNNAGDTVSGEDDSSDGSFLASSSSDVNEKPPSEPWKRSPEGRRKKARATSSRTKRTTTSKSSVVRHKSINYGKSSSSVTVVADNGVIAGNAKSDLNVVLSAGRTKPTTTTTNTVIDLTDLSSTATTMSESTTTITTTSSSRNSSENSSSSSDNTVSTSSSIAPIPTTTTTTTTSTDPPRPRKPFQCSFCPFSTERSINLQNHQLTHAEFLPPTTTKPPVVAPSSSVVVVASVSGADDVVDADIDDDDVDDFDSTDIQIDESTGVLSCTECPYTTAQLSQLNRHMLLHSDVRPYTCDKCDFACNTSLNLDIHMQTHTTGDQSKSCELEQLLDWGSTNQTKSSFSVTDFDLSFLTTSTSNSTGVNGPSSATTITTTSTTSCGGGVPSNGFANSNASSSTVVPAPSTTSSSNGLSAAVGDHPYRCARCSYSSKNLNDLKQHFGSHVDETLKAPLKCTKCNFSCNESSQLRDHFQTVHASKKAIS